MPHSRATKAAYGRGSLLFTDDGHDVAEPGLKLSGAASEIATVELLGLDPVGPHKNSLSLSFSVSADADGTWAGALQLFDGVQPISGQLPVILAVQIPVGFPSEPRAPSLDRITTEPGGEKVVTDELIVGVVFSEPDPLGVAQQVAEIAGAQIIGSVPDAKVYQMRFPHASLPDVQAKKPVIAAIPGVDFVSINIVVDAGAKTPDDDQLGTWDVSAPEGNNWNNEYVDAPAAWDLTTGSDSVRIGIIDGDMDEDHGDLDDNVVNSDRGSLTFNGHGTHVAGTACAEGNNGKGVTGIMWDCQMRFYSAGSAIETMNKMVAAVDDDNAVVNMSLQYISNGQNVPMTPALKARADETNDIFGRAVLYAQRKGKDVLWVFAAGNESQRDVEYTAPGGLAGRFPTNTMAVAASDIAGDLASYSNVGELVSVAAPGGDSPDGQPGIYSTLPRTGCWGFFGLGCRDAYGDKSGTSMAAPLVTGLAGLVKSHDPSRTAADIKRCIVAAANGHGHAIPGRPFSVINAPAAVECKTDLNLPAKVDVVLAFDLTGSMGGVVETAKEQAIAALDAIKAKAPTTDFRYSVVSHEDYPSHWSTPCGSSYSGRYGGPHDLPFRINSALTSDTATAQAAIDALTLGYGADGPEAYARLLWELGQPDTMASLGFRADALKMVIEFGDSVPHDRDINEGIGDPPGGPSDTGIDPGRNGVMDCGGDDIDFQDDALRSMKEAQVHLLFVDSEPSAYPGPYWRSWAAITGGGYTELNSERPLADVFFELFSLV